MTNDQAEDGQIPEEGGTGEGPQTVTGTTGTQSATGAREAFGDIRRRLTDEELDQPGVKRMLLDELLRAERKVSRLSSYVERYYEAERRAAVLHERADKSTALEILSGVGLVVGGAVLGITPSLWSVHDWAGPIALSLGSLMIIGSTVARLITR